MKKWKFLFYGFRHGHIYSMYDQVESSASAEVIACIEPDPVARAEAEKKTGRKFSDISYEQWLQDDIDVVAIGDVYGLRGEDIIRALKAGKHVIADKPLCTSLAQWEQIRSLSAEKDLKIGCMLDLRDIPQAQTAKAVLDSGRLGAVRNISFNGQHCLNYGQRPMWYFAPGMHGGTINDLAIHGIDLVRLLTGREFAGIDGARVWNAYAVEAPHFKDCATFMARLDSGAGVLADVSYSAPYPDPALPFYWEFRFWCDKGVLVFSCAQPDVVLYEKGDPQPVVLQSINARSSYLTEFLEEIRSNTRQVTESVLRSTKTALELQAFADKEG